MSTTQPPTIFTAPGEIGEQLAMFCRCPDCGVVSERYGRLEDVQVVCASCTITRRERNRLRIQQEHQAELAGIDPVTGKRRIKYVKHQQTSNATGRMNLNEVPKISSKYRGVS